MKEAEPSKDWSSAAVFATAFSFFFAVISCSLEYVVEGFAVDIRWNPTQIR